MPQHSSLTFDFTAEEVVLIGRTPHTTRAAHDAEVAARAMRAAGVEPTAIGIAALRAPRPERRTLRRRGKPRCAAVRDIDRGGREI